MEEPPPPTTATLTAASLLAQEIDEGTTIAAAAAGHPSFYWAVLANWLYFLSLGFNAINMGFLVRSTVNTDGSLERSPAAIALSGKVESVDKI